MEKSSDQTSFSARKSLYGLLLLVVLLAGGGQSLWASAPPAEIDEIAACPEPARKEVAVRLVGVKSYELTMLFQHLLQDLDGVSVVEPTLFTLNPRRPRSCYAEWRVTIDKLTLFEFESRLYQRLKEVAANPETTAFPGFALDITSGELADLGQISPQQATSDSLTFVQRLTFAENRLPRYSHAPNIPGTIGPWNHGFE